MHLIVWSRIALGALLFAVNTVMHVLSLLTVALLKALLRVRVVRRVCDRMLIGIAESWIDVNTWTIRTLTRTRIVVESSAASNYNGHYLVLANHQSWVDIPILQAVFNRKIPFLRFFLKSQLMWVPLLGLAWWALDFPFMKRYSREQLAKRPELAGRDIETTRRACEKFRGIPVSILIFAEGTRFTIAKQESQQAPFQNLLKPRAGGVAFVLQAMGDALHTIIDVTIVYPSGKPSFADLFANRIPEVRVYARDLEIPQDLVQSNYAHDVQARSRVQSWINTVWKEKDELLSRTLSAREIEDSQPTRANLSSRRS
jgi:1-acyl-sn-glycerol-3-phosphate acyltransferase